MTYALLSVTDKRGIGDLARGLVQRGYKLLSTGGTMKAIQDAGVEVENISAYTEFPEMLDGRVKTLHPKVHGGLLYRRDLEDHVKTVKDHGIESIDLVVCNLYDFEGHLEKQAPHEEMIENIDIGGPSMIRSAAKNYQSVYVLTDPEDYEDVFKAMDGEIDDKAFRERLAMKAFSTTAYYDAMISRYMQDRLGEKAKTLTLGLKKISDLRYGENPHQKAARYRDPMVDSYYKSIQQYQGKELSFNNLNDLNTALELVMEFKDPACVALKHATPCGVAKADTVYQAYEKAFEADSLSIFGGVVAFNQEVDGKTAEKMVEIFLEVVAAPSFSDQALEAFKKKPNLRVLEFDPKKQTASMDIKFTSGDFIIQEKDKLAHTDWKTVTKKEASPQEVKDLEFAELVCKYARSNAVVVVKDGQTLGIGGGQTSRIWALESIQTHHKDRDFTGAVLASDAFFPFDDCVKLAAKMGIKAIVQPGGSIRDEDSIKVCDQEDMAMIFTNTRHFRH